MPKRSHTELSCSPDGPWITIRGKEASLTFSLREFIRDLMPAERYSDRRMIMSDWLKARDLKARDAEGEVAKIAAPDVPPGTRLGRG
jgi:hypothetical protein